MTSPHLRLLIIDYSCENKQALFRCLKNDFDIIEAANCDEAVGRMLRPEASVRALFCDINTLREDGFALLLMMKEHAALANIPVFVTGGPYESEAERSFDEREAFFYGAAVFAALPFENEDLPARVAEAARIGEEDRRIADARAEGAKNEYNAALNESQNRERALMSQLQTVMQNFSGGITAAYYDGEKIHYLYANEGFYALFGHTRESFEKEAGGTAFSLIQPEHLPTVKEALQRSNEKKETVEHEFLAKKRDGNLIWVRGRNAVCRMEQLDTPVYITIYEDVTLQRKTEEKFRALNDRLGNSEIFMQLDITARTVEEYREGNSSNKDIEEVKSGRKRYSDFLLNSVYEKDKKAVLQCLCFDNLERRHAAGETKLTVEYRRYMPSGEIRWFCATAVLMESVISGTVNAFVYCHDINTRMKGRIARDKIVGEDADDITLINVASGISHVYKTYSGGIAEHGSFYDHDERVREFVESEVAEEDKLRCLSFLALDNLCEQLKKKESADFAFYLVKPDGSSRRKNLHLSYLDSTHDDILMVGKDITAMFEREGARNIALQHAVELANEANLAKSDFLSRMSHDMRTPLNAILGLTELAKNENRTPEIKDYLEKIDLSGQYLLSLINEILDLSSIESGKMELTEEPYPLEEFVRGVDTVIRPLMAAKNIDFVMRLADDADNIVVDKLRFTQIFFNLLSNAAKYTPEGGRVEFFTENIPGRSGKVGMRFHVRDNGIGMSRDYLKVLFDPFTREKRPAHNEQRGTGLGLSIVKRIVDALGGTISVESEMERGTEFVVDLYAYNVSRLKEEPGLLQDAPRYEDVLRDLRVLIVDDTEANVMLIKKILEYKGCLVDVARNGLEAVNMFAASEPGYFQIIMTDVRMQVMDGLEEARRIRALERPDAKTVPIIAITADAYTDSQDKTLEAGMNARLVKPVTAEEMYKAITKLLK